MEAYDFLKKRGVTRLCHFTTLKIFTHIITSSKGILSSIQLDKDVKNMNDSIRYDGKLDYICCSIQYPNSWFLKKSKNNNIDKVFREWVVIYIDLNIIKYRNSKYCPCNASKSKGAYISKDMNHIDSIYAEKISICPYPRTKKMLLCCPTDDQAEILIKSDIPRDYIIGIAVGNEEIAKQVYSILKIYQLKNIIIYISPDILDTKWSNLVRNGCIPKETRYNRSEEE